MHTILIVEDDVNISSLLRETLEREGYACVQAFSGTEARMLLSENSYAVVLLDLMLPVSPGGGLQGNPAKRKDAGDRADCQGYH